MQATLDLLRSDVRVGEAPSDLMEFSEGNWSVHQYSSELKAIGGLVFEDETSWLNVYVWGLQPLLARDVAVKYPTAMAQALGHARATELAHRASQLPSSAALSPAASIARGVS